MGTESERAAQKSCCEIMTEEEFRKKYKELPYFSALQNSLGKHRMSYCKAEAMKDGIIGTITVPDRNYPDEDCLTVSYYLTKREILFVDQEAHMEQLGNVIGRVKDSIAQEQGAVHFFYCFLEYLIRDDLFCLQEKEKELVELEENLDKIDSKTLTRHLMLERRKLLEWSGYYRQMTDLGEILSENPTRFLDKEEENWFRLFSEQTKRLMDHTLMLREYSMSIREMFQTIMDIRQNDIMKVLTVVTVIFLPLSQIAAWYGMNFEKMPELTSEHGYEMVIVLSIGVFLAELWFFKRKRWI